MLYTCLYFLIQKCLPLPLTLCICLPTPYNYVYFLQAAEDATQTSYNPFLVNDPNPSLLLDYTVSGPSTSPLKDVLEYFKKDSPLNPDNSFNSKSNQSSKGIPPPRPPLPSSSIVCDTFDNNVHVSKWSPDNNFLNMITAKEGLLEHLYNTLLNLQLSGDLYSLLYVQ